VATGAQRFGGSVHIARLEHAIGAFGRSERRVLAALVNMRLGGAENIGVAYHCRTTLPQPSVARPATTERQ